ncbi:replication initiation factor domain-containing protein [Streptococcus suis]|uniref:replication initiation factor domain-containing protein n=1 Tax=Streptococcus suis TaxID=1307 RepID=UPI0004189133|nr:replication initiation factor domain-containing protein [Streptococcus suis]HEM3178752.1 replication initiation factor domain-containing protein [Streptococcus suis 92-4172]
MFENEEKRLKNDDLRKVQEDFSPDFYKEKIEVSIDRLTLLVDAYNPIYLIRDLKNVLIEELQGYIEYSVISSDYKSFSLEYVTEDDIRVNLMYVEVTMFREILLRIDFNPNTLKEYGAMEIWQKIIVFLTLQSEEIRLSRFDLAFDVFNLPSVVTVKHIKGGTKSTFYYGRSYELETVYWGSRASNVQVRLYDKNKERLQKGKLTITNLEDNPYWWRFEMQLRTKAINADMVSEVMKRLENFGIYDYSKLGGNKAFTYIFFQDESMLPYVFDNLSRNSIKTNKQRLRKRLRELDNEFSRKLIAALREQSPKLAKELKQYTQEFLGFE